MSTFRNIYLLISLLAGKFNTTPLTVNHVKNCTLRYYFEVGIYINQQNVFRGVLQFKSVYRRLEFQERDVYVLTC